MCHPALVAGSFSLYNDFMFKKLDNRKFAYLALLGNTIFWGAAFTIVKAALGHTTPFRYLLYRYILAAFFSLPILFYYLPKIKDKLKSLLIITALELIGLTLSLGLLYEGLSRTSSIEANLLVAATPIFTIIGGIIFLKEKEEKHEAIGLVLAFMGTILLTLIPFINAGNPDFQFSTTGSALIVAQNITTAVYFILIKKYYKPYPKFYVTSVSFYVGIISFLILATLEAGGFTTLRESIAGDLGHGSVIFASFYMAIFGSIIGLTLYIIGQSKIEVSEASLFYYLQPAIYIPLGMVWLDEKVNPVQLGALVLIIAGVYVASRRIKKKK